MMMMFDMQVSEEKKRKTHRIAADINNIVIVLLRYNCIYGCGECFMDIFQDGADAKETSRYNVPGLLKKRGDEAKSDCQEERVGGAKSSRSAG